MKNFLLSVLLLLSLTSSWTSRADADTADASEAARIGCVPPSNFNDSDDTLGLDPDDRRPPAQGGWSQCEKWVWSCVRRGEEANLYARTCTRTRSEEAKNLRDSQTLFPFENPNHWRQSNALGSQFIADMLHKPIYSRQLSANGVRIVGGYFGRQLSLENIITTVNLVLDHSVFKEGIRLTNFRSENNLSLDGSNVRGNVLMNRIHLGGSLFLQDGIFDHIDLRDARIGASVDAPGSFFVGTVRLDRARVEGKVNFVNARLTELSGWDLIVGGSLWMRNADIRGRMDFTGARIASDVRMQKVTFGRRIDREADLCDWDLSHAQKLFIDDINKPGQEARLKAVLVEMLDDRPVKGSSVDMCTGRGARPVTAVEPGLPTPLPTAAAALLNAPAIAPETREALSGAAPPGSDTPEAARQAGEREMAGGSGLSIAVPATASTLSSIAGAGPHSETAAAAQGAAQAAAPGAAPGEAQAAPQAVASGETGVPMRLRKVHEVRLRDMTINGTLCLIDLTGEFGNLAPPITKVAGSVDGTVTSTYPQNAGAGIETISLDGTEARSTIIRWKLSDSRTLWRAVQFKTGNLIIDLGSQPRRHYIDALEIKNISFLRSDGRTDPPPEDEDFMPYLCDMRPGNGGAYTQRGSVGLDAASREAHQRIVTFFTATANESRSAQPFTKIAERLNDSGASSLFLKMELGDFTTRQRCSSSELFKDYERTPPQTWSAVWPHFKASFRSVLDGGNLKGKLDWVDETKNVGLDAVCRGMFKAYKYSAAYGHQPHNVFIVIGIFVVLFWLMLRFDTPPHPAIGGTSSRLGILYAIDMFVPFVKMNAENALKKPQKRWLRGYLIAHRVIGLVLTSLLVLGFYVQRH